MHLVRIVTYLFTVLMLTVVCGSTNADIYLPKNVGSCVITFEKSLPNRKGANQFIPHGTGFIIHDSASGLNYAVTNRHVLEKMDSIYVRFNVSSGDSIVGKRLVLKLVRNGKPTFRGHPDSTIDLAVIAIPTDLSVYALEIQRLKYFDEVELGDPVMYLGFPLLEAAIGDLNYPVVRYGIVSFKSKSAIKGFTNDKVLIHERHILIDGLVMPGNSGSPVLSIPKSNEGRMTIVGVLSSHIFDLGSGEDYQLGICIPAEKLRETIDDYQTALNLKK